MFSIDYNNYFDIPTVCQPSTRNMRDIFFFNPYKLEEKTDYDEETLSGNYPKLFRSMCTAAVYK